jgi:hypothetical protein
MSEVAEEHSSSIIKVTTIGEQETTPAFLPSVHRLVITANVVNSSPNLVTLMTDLLRSSETSAYTRTIYRNSPEDGILPY